MKIVVCTEMGSGKRSQQPTSVGSWILWWTIAARPGTQVRLVKNTNELKTIVWNMQQIPYNGDRPPTARGPDPAPFTTCSNCSPCRAVLGYILWICPPCNFLYCIFTKNSWWETSLCYHCRLLYAVFRVFVMNWENQELIWWKFHKFPIENVLPHIFADTIENVLSHILLTNFLKLSAVFIIDIFIKRCYSCSN